MDTEVRGNGAQNGATQTMQDAARSLEQTVRASSHGGIVPSLGGTEDRHALFGEGSLFPLGAQGEVLRSLEDDVTRREEEGSRARGVVEGMLSMGRNTTEEAPDDEAVQAEESEHRDKGKGVQRREDQE